MHLKIGTSSTDISNSCDGRFNYNKIEGVSQMVFVKTVGPAAQKIKCLQNFLNTMIISDVGRRNVSQ